MTKHPSYRARDQPQNGSASQHRKEIVMHKFEKRDAKSRTLVILAVVGLAAAITVGIFTAVRMIRKPAQSKDDPKTGIVYDDSDKMKSYHADCNHLRITRKYTEHLSGNQIKNQRSDKHQPHSSHK